MSSFRMHFLYCKHLFRSYVIGSNASLHIMQKYPFTSFKISEEVEKKLAGHGETLCEIECLMKRYMKLDDRGKIISN